MRVVHIVWSLSFGGIETMLVNIANAQTQEGVEVTVVIINDLYDESLVNSFCDKVNLVFLYRKQHSYSFGFVIRLNRTLCRINPDVIHLHSSRIYEIIFNRDLRRKVCVTLHDLPTGTVRPQGILYRMFPFLSVCKPGIVRFIDKVPKVFAISDAVKKTLLENYGISSTVICNGICTANFKTRKTIPYSSQLRIIQVSRLEHEKKGQDLLIRAISRFKGEVEVYFIGDGKSLKYLKELTAKLGIEKCVHFLGKQTQKEVAHSLCEYDLFVQPSRSEGFGLTVAEAMSAQIPVLASTGQGPAEIICGNKYGWLFENGNADDLARMIKYICTHYTEALNKATEGRQYVIQTYDVAITAKKYLKGYNTIKDSHLK